MLDLEEAKEKAKAAAKKLMQYMADLEKAKEQTEVR